MMQAQMNPFNHNNIENKIPTGVKNAYYKARVKYETLEVEFHALLKSVNEKFNIFDLGVSDFADNARVEVFKNSLAKLKEQGDELANLGSEYVRTRNEYESHRAMIWDRLQVEAHANKLSEGNDQGQGTQSA